PVYETQSRHSPILGRIGRFGAGVGALCWRWRCLAVYDGGGDRQDSNCQPSLPRTSRASHGILHITALELLHFPGHFTTSAFPSTWAMMSILCPWPKTTRLIGNQQPRRRAGGLRPWSCCSS